ncbi:sec7 domain protein [Ichthyophthirius multifiliis]|uniref:Sec7 domain protein n=1 Tax=Ichthyophthirius multifiliis TaxID=5932 RepID=G0QQ76_ICHMU|nr:sec7 domain protein [Ichthyophthirius multifiliis]EGR32636.1 sec7 domain protein [Ichthyophthirius multifiliis]|eukprot:XP_004036622.1 sec7 domain protein [Ichthyophthirius multifiliis]
MQFIKFPIQFQKKHFILIKNILNFALKTANYLRKSWYFILSLISKLNQLRLTKSQIEIKRKNHNFQEEVPFSIQNVYFELDQIEKIYANSMNLDGESVLDFITALCKVSDEELNQNSSLPLIFSLQKVIETAEFNMNRIVIVWNRIWQVIRDHFANAGQNQNINIAMNAVDNLKQLSQKFFTKKERFNLTYQKDFLKTFEIIYQKVNVQNIFIKIFILDCIRSFCTSYFHKIKSGWRIIFNIVNFALQEENQDLSNNSFQILKLILDNNLDIIYDFFADLVQCLASLSKKKDENYAFASIDYVQKCLYYISDKSKNNETLNPKTKETYWVPLLGVLSNLCGDQRPNVQVKSMDCLFSILSLYGHMFSIEFWKIIFQGVLRPLFDEIQFTFQQMITKNLHSLLIEFIRTYENCINNTNEQIIQISVNASKNTILTLGVKFQENDWEIILDFFDRMIRLTTPNKLFEINLDENGEYIVQDVKGKRKQSFLQLQYFKIEQKKYIAHQLICPNTVQIEVLINQYANHAKLVLNVEFKMKIWIIMQENL